MSKADPDFPAQPTYSQTSNSNSSWVNVTVTKTSSDGTRTQTSHIEPRVKSK